MYCELEKRLLSQHFTSFINLVGHAHDHLCLIWWIKLMSGIPYAKCFLKVDYIYACHRCNRMSHKYGDQRKLGSHSRFYETAICESYYRFDFGVEVVFPWKNS